MLTIINTLLICYLLVKGNNKLSITFRKEESFVNETLLGYNITLWKAQSYGADGIYHLYIPIRSRKKTELREEIKRMMTYSYQSKLQILTAKFSWLKTFKEMRQFQKHYSVVDKDIVENLVNNFKK